MTISNVTKIRNDIITAISQNNEIKRFIYYLTPTPLESKGINLNGEINKQPDISEIDFVGEIKRIHSVYNSDEIFGKEYKVSIVCRIQEYDLQESFASIAIDIICPEFYSKIDKELDRKSAIADRICILVRELKGVTVTKAVNSTPVNHEDYNIITLFLKVTM